MRHATRANRGGTRANNATARTQNCAGGTGGCFAAGTLVWTIAGLVPIQQVEVGQRVQSEVCESSVTNGTLASHWEAIGRTQLPEEDSDESLTRVDLALTDEFGARYEVTALRPAEWLSQHYDPEAGRAWIEFPEIGLRGWAKVKGLSPAEIEPGPGRLVTATFGRTASGILEISIGEDQLTVTREHRFYSVDRGAWVPAGSLHVNELVATDDGPVQVASIAQRPGAIPVYNLEIEGTHTYHVGRARVLVHNNGCPASPRTLFHYTDEAGQRGIVESGELRPSTKANNPNDVRYGDCQYLSDTAPGTRTNAELSRDFLGQPFQGDRFSHYVEIDVSDLPVEQGRPGVFVNPSSTPLDVSGRIVSTGTNE